MDSWAGRNESTGRHRCHGRGPAAAAAAAAAEGIDGDAAPAATDGRRDG